MIHHCLTVCKGFWEMHRGFTLLELLITVAFLVVLLLFGAPSFSKVSQKTKMANLANELHGFLIQ
ncbi:general secretion pathway protein GspH, partial [Vibrio parahaemolyticus]